MILRFIVMAAFSVIGTTGQTQVEFNLRADCDIPNHTIESKKNTDLSGCKKLCGSKKSCRAFVHISHWNRCFLKSKDKPEFKVVMLAAEKMKDASFTNAEPRTDSTGKDFKNIFTLKSRQSCQQECSGNPKCHSYVFIEGYSSCYLKLAGGKIVSKTFTCGFKKEITKK